MNKASDIGIRALRCVTLVVPSLEGAREFYAGDWGLDLVHDSAERISFRGTGSEHHVVEFVVGDGRGLGHVAFAAASPREIDNAAERIASLGVAITSQPHHSDEPGGGYRFGFRDPEGRHVVLSALVEAVAPRQPLAARPSELSHVVFNTVDLDAAVDFWTGVLGLVVSDWSEHQMAFLRCNRRHHSIAFNQAEWTSVNHIAYEVPDVDGFMQRLGRLRQAGHTPLWGPGRHGPGNNAFAYFGDPLGFVPEVTTGLIEVDESRWVPRVWQRVPDQSDLWGTAGPPSREARSRMAGTPDPTSPSHRAPGPAP